MAKATKHRLTIFLMVDLVIDTTLPVTLTLPEKQNKLKIEACPCFDDFIISKFDLKSTKKEYP